MQLALSATNYIRIPTLHPLKQALPEQRPVQQTFGARD